MNGQSRETGNIGLHKTQEEDKQNTTKTTQKTKNMNNSNILVITISKHTETNTIRHDPPPHPYKQLEVNNE